MENSTTISPKICTPFNNLDWSAYMHISLRNKGMYRMTMGIIVEPQQHIENSKYPNRIDEAFSYMCIHISKELLFHLDGLRTSKEVWDKLEFLFGK